jgi:hypothetical protein
VEHHTIGGLCANWLRKRTIKPFGLGNQVPERTFHYRIPNELALIRILSINQSAPRKQCNAFILFHDCGLKLISTKHDCSICRKRTETSSRFDLITFFRCPLFSCLLARTPKAREVSSEAGPRLNPAEKGRATVNSSCYANVICVWFKTQQERSVETAMMQRKVSR